ncbi:hypothetical protein TB2_000005 [Malus domestica]
MDGFDVIFQPGFYFVIHEENKTQLSSSISEEENSTHEVKAVKTEPLEIPEIKKRKCLSRSELKELRKHHFIRRGQVVLRV